MQYIINFNLDIDLKMSDVRLPLIMVAIAIFHSVQATGCIIFLQRLKHEINYYFMESSHNYYEDIVSYVANAVRIQRMKIYLICILMNGHTYETDHKIRSTFNM